MNRRDFLGNLSRQTATVAVAASSPAIAHLNSITDDLKIRSKELNKKIANVVSETKDQIQTLQTDLSSVAFKMSKQKLQLYIIFLLLLLSFAIDAGISAALVLI